MNEEDLKKILENTLAHMKAVNKCLTAMTDEIKRIHVEINALKARKKIKVV